MEQRIAQFTRKTEETDIACRLNLDGTGIAQVETGIRFFDHMLNAFAKHARFDLELSCEGDLEVDDHHSVEDCALVMECLMRHWQQEGITRYGSAHVPLDEALCRAAVDLSGRPYPAIDLGLERERLGALSCENIAHFFQSSRLPRRFLHVDMLKGRNDHHQ